MNKTKNTKLVKTDYDNFRDMTFFIKQQKKANEMLREVHDFQKSFILSKFISFREFVEQNPTFGMNLFADIKFTYYIDESTGKDYGCIHVEPGCPVVYRRSEDFSDLNVDPFVYYAFRKAKITKKQEKLLDQFYFAMFSQFEISHCTHNYYLYGPPMRDKINADTHCAMFEGCTNIITDWRPFINKEQLAATVKYNRLDSCRPAWRFFYKWDSHNLFEDGAHEQCYEIMRNRFKNAIELFTELYMRDTEGTIQRNWNKEYGTPDDKKFIVWNNEPQFVSTNPDDYTATVSQDEQMITFRFNRGLTQLKRNRMYKGPDVYGIGWDSPARTCELTYSTKNNELIKFQKYV